MWPKKVALKEGIELITLGFAYHVLTSIPLKLQKLTLPERTFLQDLACSQTQWRMFALNERIELVIFGFWFVVVTYDPMKIYLNILFQRTFEPI